MNIINLIKNISFEKDAHFISVTYKEWKKYKYILLLLVYFNKNYKSCLIFRKHYKYHKDFVVIGLKWHGHNIKRRTTGYAKSFLKKHSLCNCIYCGTPLSESNATADHIIPISSGGNNSQVNLVICCFNCNNERGNITFNNYIRLKNDKYKDILFI